MTDKQEESVNSNISRELKRYRNLGLLVVMLSFLGFVGWIALAPLDEGVPASGQVSNDTRRKAVQHFTGGVISQIQVREGDLVNEGATLIRLEDSSAKANLEIVRQRYHSLLAMRGRLHAERDGLPEPSWPEELLAIAKEAPVAAHMRVQADLMRTRRAALQADQEAARQSIAGFNAQIEGIRSVQPIRQTQLESLRSELQALQPSIDANYVPRNRQFELQRQINDVQILLNDAASQQQRLNAAKLEIQQRMVSREAEFRREAQVQLTEVTRDLQTDAQRIIAVQQELGRTEIKAPVGGQVVGLAYQTVGGVIPAGQKIMDIVPTDDGLVIEARVSPQFVDRIKKGTLVDVRFTAFAQTPQLLAEGMVLTVSADALTDAQTGQSYFLVRVGLTPNGMSALGKREMQPGMTAEVVFMTGSRTVLNYLLHPLTKRLAAAMKEE